LLGVDSHEANTDHYIRQQSKLTCIRGYCIRKPFPSSRNMRGVVR